jgi:hypothetical protein
MTVAAMIAARWALLDMGVQRATLIKRKMMMKRKNRKRRTKLYDRCWSRRLYLVTANSIK